MAPQVGLEPTTLRLTVACSTDLSLIHISPHLHFEPIYLVVFKGSYLVNPVGYLILWSASCLDAFSVYPIRT